MLILLVFLKNLCQNVTSSGNKIFADIIRSDEILLDPNSSEWYLYNRKERKMQTQRHLGNKAILVMGTEAEAIGSHQWQAKEHKDRQEPPEAKDKQGRVLS